MKTTAEQRAELRRWAVKAKVAMVINADTLTALLDDLDEVTAERDALADKLDRVRELHAPTPLGYGDLVSRWDDRRPCAACRRTSPCPTVRAIDTDGGE